VLMAANYVLAVRELQKC